MYLVGVMDFFSLFQMMFLMGILYNPLASSNSTCISLQEAHKDSFVYDYIACGLNLVLDPNQARKDLKIPASVVNSINYARFITIFFGIDSKELKLNCLIVLSQDKEILTIFCPPKNGKESFNTVLFQKEFAKGIVYFSPRKQNLI